MLLFYRILITIALPLICLRLLWKSRRNPAYRQRMAERFACALPPTLPHLYWVHTVSVGEFLALKPLLEALLEREPQRCLWITCTTPTASAQIQAWQALYPHRLRHSYMPYDHPWLLKRFWRHICPKALILMETELWPNTILEASRHVPVLLENARLSARSCRRYRRFAAPLLRRILPLLHINAQHRWDAKRFRYLGATRVNVTPNLKYHTAVPPSIDLPQTSDKKAIYLAASTHEGEEALLLAAWSLLLKQQPEAQLWLAPRHPERRDDIQALALKMGLTPTLRSRQEAPSSLYLIDTLGELRTLFALADVAFIGGSLIPRGGHNPLEALQAGTPVCFGTSMFHFQAIRDELIHYPFVLEIKNHTAEALAAALLQLYARGDMREAIAAYMQPYQDVLAQHLRFWQEALHEHQ